MFIQYAFDAIIVSLIILVGIKGFRRGFLISLTSMSAKIAAIVAAVFLHAPFTKFLDSIFNLRERVSPKVSSLVNNAIAEKASTITSNPIESLFGFSMKDMIAYQLTNTITSYVLKIIAFLLLVFIIYFLFSIIISIFMKPLIRIKPIAALDKTAGLLVSCICVIFFIALFCGLTQPFWQVAPRFESAAKSTFSYPLLMRAYEPFINAINTFFGNVFVNPLDSLPAFNSTQI